MSYLIPSHEDRLLYEESAFQEAQENIRKIIQAAKWEEREACAKVAASYPDVYGVGNTIAEQIRNRRDT